MTPELKLIRMDIAFWALLTQAIVVNGWWSWAFMIAAGLLWLQIRQLERSMSPPSGPGFWARVWGR
jgi:hypothetical protein